LCQFSFTKKLQSQTVSREKLRKSLFIEKAAKKMLEKLTPGQVVGGVDPTKNSNPSEKS